MYSFTITYDSATYNVSEPVNWKDIELILRKSNEYDGIFFERGGNISFYGSARDIILTALDNGHFESEVLFEATDMCDNTVVFEGRLNLTSYTDEDSIFTCNIENTNKLIVFNNNINRKESVISANSIQVDLHGLIFDIFTALSWLPTEPTEDTSPDPYSPTPATNKAFFSVRTDEPDFYEYFVWEEDGTDTWLRCIKNVTINFTIPVIQMGTGFDNCIVASTDNFSPAHEASFTVFGQTVTLRPYDFDPMAGELYKALGGYDYEEIFEGGTYSRVCNVGDILNMRYFFQRNPSPTGCDSVVLYSGSAKLRWGEAFLNNPPDYPAVDNTVKIFFGSDPFPTSRVKGYLVHDLLNFLVQKASNNQLEVYSKFYGRNGQRDYGANGCGAFRVLTTGLHIRDKNTAFASFKQIFDGLKAIDNLALAMENIGGTDYIRIEPKDSFFDNTPIFTANNVDIKKSLATSKIFKLLDIGYQKWESEYTEGVLEFNSTRQYESTNITQFKEAKNAISNLIAGSYLIEKTRRARFKETTDTENDNDWFVICVQSGSTPFTAEQTGTKKYYNTRINPNRNALNYQKEFSASTVLNVGGSLAQKARTGGFVVDKTDIGSPCNNGFTSILDGTLIPLNVPIYKCIFVEFEVPMTKAEFDTIKSNVRRSIRFYDCTGIEQRGYLEEMRYKITEGLAKIRLILI